MSATCGSAVKTALSRLFVRKQGYNLVDGQCSDIEHFGAQCNKVRDTLGGVFRIDVLLLLTVLGTVFLGSLGFYFGITCSAAPFWLMFAVCSLLACTRSWKTLFFYWGTIGGMVLLTMFTWSYTGTDAMNYHFPMQHLIRDGWNPLFDSTIEKFKAVAELGRCSLYHTLFLPKFTSVLGAYVGAAFGLWVADSFLGYVLIALLFYVSVQFARMFWGRSSVVDRIVFATAITFSTKITSFCAGQVDYTVYAAMVLSFFSLWMYAEKRLLHDGLVFFLGALVCSLAKSTGLVCSGILLFGGLCVAWRKAFYRWSLVSFCVCFIVVGSIPYFTSWIQYGGPLFPAMTFNPAVQTVDITADFTGNEDALRMGYLARIVYAWVSPWLAVKSCAWWYGDPDFSPVFTVAGGVAGLGTVFRLLLGASLGALMCSKKNKIFWLCVITFVLSNFAPLKYLGYNRYFPQIWIIPFVALLNFFYNPLPRMKLFAQRWIRYTVLVGCVLLSSVMIVRTVAYQCRMAVLEDFRQSALHEMREVSEVWRVPQTEVSYTLRERLRVAGIKLSAREDVPRASVNRQFLYVCKENPEAVKAVAERFPICDTFTDLIKFPWGEALSKCPLPLWENGFLENNVGRK